MSDPKNEYVSPRWIEDLRQKSEEDLFDFLLDCIELEPDPAINRAYLDDLVARDIIDPRTRAKLYKVSGMVGAPRTREEELKAVAAYQAEEDKKDKAENACFFEQGRLGHEAGKRWRMKHPTYTEAEQEALNGLRKEYEAKKAFTGGLKAGVLNKIFELNEALCANVKVLQPNLAPVDEYDGVYWYCSGFAEGVLSLKEARAVQEVAGPWPNWRLVAVNVS